VAVTAHLDTVLAPRVVEEVTVQGDGRLLGPGVADNGAGLAALLAIAAAWSASPPCAPAPLLIANVGEEGEGNLSGMRYLCRNPESKGSLASRVKAFLVLDGPGCDRITSRALASRRYDVTITGPGGHSWSDHGAGNPVHSLARAVTHFCDNAGFGRGTSYNFGLIQGGASVNAIPIEARAKVDLRAIESTQLDRMVALLIESVDRAVETENARASGGRVTGRWREIGSRPAGELNPSSELLAALLAVDQHLGLRSIMDTSSTDANIPLSLGLPAVSIGAGGDGGGAHTPNEWYSPDGRELGLRRVLLTVAMLLA
jgi:acetylornithine deacetylase/succinyl-diaminopimelate desuccinylase-like protein